MQLHLKVAAHRFKLRRSEFSHTPQPATTAATPSGSMKGTYQMVTDAGKPFDAEIAPFRLALPSTLN